MTRNHLVWSDLIPGTVIEISDLPGSRVVVLDASWPSLTAESRTGQVFGIDGRDTDIRICEQPWREPGSGWSSDPAEAREQAETDREFVAVIRGQCFPISKTLCDIQRHADAMLARICGGKQ